MSSRRKRCHLLPLESVFYYLLLAGGLAAAWEGCPGAAELGCSGSRCLGRTWRSCAGPAGSVPMAQRSREERQWASTAAKVSSAQCFLSVVVEMH